MAVIYVVCTVAESRVLKEPHSSEIASRRAPWRPAHITQDGYWVEGADHPGAGPKERTGEGGRQQNTTMQEWVHLGFRLKSPPPDA